MPAGLRWIAEHQPVTPIADTLRALMLDTPVGNEAIRRARPGASRASSSAASAPRICSDAVSSARTRCSRSTPAAIRRLAIRNQRLAGPAAPRRSRPRRTCSRRRGRCAACSWTRPRSSPATTCSCCSPATARSTRRCSSRSPTSERDLFEYWAHEASYVLSEDLPIHRYAMMPPAGRRVARAHERSGGRARPTSARTSSSGSSEEGPLRARDIEDRATVAWESSGWTHARNVARMLDLMWVRGQVGISRREGAQRVWDLMERCLPPDAPQEELSDEEVTRRAAPLRDPRARRRPHPAHPRALHPRPLPAPGARCSSSCSATARSSASRSTASATTGGSTPRTSRRSSDDFKPPHRAAEPVRQPALRPRPHRGAVRLHPPARDLHAQAQAPLGLLRAARARRRPARRPHRPRDGPQARHAGGARGPRRAEGRRAASGSRRRSAGSSSGSRPGAGRPGSRCSSAPPEWLGILAVLALFIVISSPA